MKSGRRHYDARAILVALALLMAPRVHGATAPPHHSGGEPTSDDLAGGCGHAAASSVINFLEVAAGEAASVDAWTAGRSASPQELAPGPGRNMLGPYSPAPTASFLAREDVDAVGYPDTSGAVGPAHLMTALETGYSIQTRDGVVLSETTSITAFWLSVLEPGSAVWGSRVIYDSLAGHFVTASVGWHDPGPEVFVLVGVSQTADPTAQWNLFRVVVNPTSGFVDYPNLGFNKDWLVLTTDRKVSVDGFALDHRIFIFTKSELYSGAGANFRWYTFLDGSHVAPALTYDASLGTEYLLEHYDAAGGKLRLSKITGPAGAEVVSVGIAYPIGAPYADPPPYLIGFEPGFAPQLGTAVKIWTGEVDIKNLVYRNGSLWAAQTVYLPAGTSPTRTSVQWWQVATDGTVLQQGLIDDPAGALYYAYPSIAANRDGDALVGFSRFSASQYASADYAFRWASDPPASLETELVLKLGESAHPPFGNPALGALWGRHSATMVDPTDDTGFWTLQEYADPGGALWGTWWGYIVPGPGCTLPPPSPGDTLRATKGSAKYVDLEWGPVAGATAYNVLRCDASAAPCTPSILGTVTPPTYTTYDNVSVVSWYGIEAVNPCGATP